MSDMVSKGRSCHGDQKWNVVVTKENVIRMRDMFNDGIPVPKLVNQFGYKYETIYQIVHHKRWIEQA